MRRFSLRNGILLAGAFVVACCEMNLFAADDVVPTALVQPVVAQRPDATPEAAVLLKYCFEPNQTVHYKVTHKSSIISQVARTKRVSHSECTTFKHFQVIEKTPGDIATLETAIDRIQQTVQFDDEKAESYDSGTDAAPPAPLRKVVKSIGKPLAQMQFTPDGRLLDVKVVPEEGEKEPEPESGDDRDSSNFLITMPDYPVRVGDSWKSPFTVSVSVPPNPNTPITLNRKYTLTALENGVATIRLQTTILTAVNNPAVKAQLIQRTPEGTIMFDVKKGLITSRSLNLDETVHEFAGGGSEMRAVSTLEETLIEPAAISAKPAEFGPAPR